jgi:hypothetical protein
MLCTPHYYTGDQNRQKERGRAHTIRKRCNVHTEFWWVNLLEGDHLEDPGKDGRIKINGSSRSRMGCTDWIDVANDRDRW